MLAAVLTIALAQQPAGFLVEPRIPHAPGVLVLHPWWGLNSDIKALCGRLAKSGYVAFAPDLFQGKTAKTRPEAEALVHAYESKEPQLNQRIERAAQFLADKIGKKPIAVIGLSFGAYYALHLSNTDPSRVRAVVVFYGTGQQDFTKSKARYLGHFADKDEFEPKKNVDQLAKLLKTAHRPAELYTYPNTGHWFFEPSVKSAYNQAAADLAWKRTLKFLAARAKPR